MWANGPSPASRREGGPSSTRAPVPSRLGREHAGEGPVARQQARRRSVLHQAPAFKHQHTVAGGAEAPGDQADRSTRREAGGLFEEFHLSGGIEGRGGLVEHREVGARARERPGDGEALPLAAGEVDAAELGPEPGIIRAADRGLGRRVRAGQSHEGEGLGDSAGLAGEGGAAGQGVRVAPRLLEDRRRAGAARLGRGMAARSTSSQRRAPSVGCRKPRRICASVVFPAPSTPTSATTSPARISGSVSLGAGVSAPR